MCFGTNSSFRSAAPLHHTSLSLSFEVKVHHLFQFPFQFSISISFLVCICISDSITILLTLCFLNFARQLRFPRRWVDQWGNEEQELQFSSIFKVKLHLLFQFPFQFSISISFFVCVCISNSITILLTPCFIEFCSSVSISRTMSRSEG